MERQRARPAASRDPASPGRREETPPRCRAERKTAGPPERRTLRPTFHQRGRPSCELLSSVVPPGGATSGLPSMDWKAPQLMIDPHDGEEPALSRASYGGVVHDVPPDLGSLDSLWVVQRLFNLSAHNPALRMIPLQVPDIRRVPGHWPVVHPYSEYIRYVDQSPYGRSIQSPESARTNWQDQKFPTPVDDPPPRCYGSDRGG